MSPRNGKRRREASPPGEVESPQQQATACDSVSSDEEDGPMRTATQEELRDEVNRHSAVLDELLPGARQEGRGSKRGRGRGGARSGGGPGSGGLLVSRFIPAGTQAEETTPSNKEPEEGVSVAVNPTFARLFKGGPRRKEADLPEREDEGLEENVKVQEQAPGEGASDWLSSLTAAPEAEQRPAEVTWLGSLKRQKASAAGMVEMSKAAEAWAGRALDIPPFWRTKTEEELQQEFLQTRTFAWHRMKRLARDAKRKEEKRGRVRGRPTV